MLLLLKTNVYKVIFAILLIVNVFSQVQENVEYSKNRKINLGALSIDGEVVVPDDLSVDVNEKDYSLDLFRRVNFSETINKNFNVIY